MNTSSSVPNLATPACNTGPDADREQRQDHREHVIVRPQPGYSTACNAGSDIDREQHQDHRENVSLSSFFPNLATLACNTGSDIDRKQSQDHREHVIVRPQSGYSSLQHRI